MLTGERGVGKTTWLLEACREWQAAGRALFGVAEPKAFERGEMVGIAAVDVASWRTATLAVRDDLPGVRLGPWRFLGEGIAFANECCRPGSREGVAIVDEIGPLELRGDGLAIPWVALQTGQYRRAVVVVRADLLEAVRRRVAGDVQVLHWPAPGEPGRLDRLRAHLNDALF